jgi:hypothetical protein
MAPALLAPGILPELWSKPEIAVRNAIEAALKARYLELPLILAGGRANSRVPLQSSCGPRLPVGHQPPAD